jgi:hypothetical protein
VTRLTVTVDAAPQEFRVRYERAVPPAPLAEARALAARGAPWSDMIDLIDRSAPLGFVIYNVIDAELMRPAGDYAFCVSYLMGNHTIAERMFRYHPAVLLYAPLRTAIWARENGPTHFTFDQPSLQFGSFGNREITKVGLELDRKMATLLERLGVRPPDALLASSS